VIYVAGLSMLWTIPHRFLALSPEEEREMLTQHDDILRMRISFWKDELRVAYSKWKREPLLYRIQAYERQLLYRANEQPYERFAQNALAPQVARARALRDEIRAVNVDLARDSSRARFRRYLGRDT